MKGRRESEGGRVWDLTVCPWTRSDLLDTQSIGSASISLLKLFQQLNVGEFFSLLLT